MRGIRLGSTRLTGARLASIGFLALVLASAAAADSITGTVANGTTGKPAPGVSVTLVNPMAGMEELATTKSDARGHFTFQAPPPQGPRLVRAERGGVNYFKMITPGTESVDLNVYDAAPSVEGIAGAADVVKVQSEGSTLQVIELFAINNNSNPPRTLASAATFEFVLPEGAQLDGGNAQAPNGQPISVQPAATRQKNHYAFAFALKPGETRLQVSYHLPYSGQASFTPRLTRDFEHYVLVVPASMTFTPNQPKQFQAMGNQPGTNVQVSMQAKAGQDLGYAISGTGVFPEESADAAPANTAPAARGRDANMGPGGGLGRPEDAPDGLTNYRWYILAALLTVLVGGGIWTHERTRQEEAMTFVETAPQTVPAANVPQPLAAPAAVVAVAQPIPSNLLLQALKEELFALEVERQQGKISPEEYDKARAALEQTLQRALTRRPN